LIRPNRRTNPVAGFPVITRIGENLARQNGRGNDFNGFSLIGEKLARQNWRGNKIKGLILCVPPIRGAQRCQGAESCDPHARPGNQNAAKPKFDPETGEILEENKVRNTKFVSRGTDTADYILSRLRRDAESHPDPELRVKAGDLLALQSRKLAM